MCGFSIRLICSQPIPEFTQCRFDAEPQSAFLAYNAAHLAFAVRKTTLIAMLAHKEIINSRIAIEIMLDRETVAHKPGFELHVVLIVKSALIVGNNAVMAKVVQVPKWFLRSAHLHKMYLTVLKT